MHADDICLVGQSASQRADLLGLGVERRLQIFERQRKVEDRDIARIRFGGRQSRPRCHSPERGPPRCDGPAKEPGAGVLWQVLERLAHGAVDVEIVDLHGNGIAVGHHCTMNGSKVCLAWATGIGTSTATGAGSFPGRARAQAACRASTDTTRAAAARVLGVRVAACPLYTPSPVSSSDIAVAMNFAGAVAESPKPK